MDPKNSIRKRVWTDEHTNLIHTLLDRGEIDPENTGKRHLQRIFDSYPVFATFQEGNKYRIFRSHLGQIISERIIQSTKNGKRRKDLLDGSVIGTDEKKARTEDKTIVSFTNEEDNDTDLDFVVDDDDDDDELVDLDESQVFQDAVEEAKSPPASETPPESIMVGLTTPKRTTFKSSAKAKMSATPTSKKKSTSAAKKQTKTDYVDYLSSKLSKVNITNAEEGVSRITSGTGTPCLVLPTIKWVYTTKSQDFQAVHVHLPSSWNEKNLRDITLTAGNKGFDAHFVQSRIFLKKTRLMFGKEGLEMGHAKVEALGSEIDRIYKSELVKENNKKYPYVLSVDLDIQVEDKYNACFRTYNVRDAGNLNVLELDFESVEKPEDTYTTKIKSEVINDEFADSDEESLEEFDEEMHTPS